MPSGTPISATSSRQKRLEVPTDLGRELSQAAMELARGCWNMENPVRALTVTAIYLIPAGEAGAQLDLFAGEGEEKRHRLEKLEGTMDAIRARYGPGAIAHASAPRDGGGAPRPAPRGPRGIWRGITSYAGAWR